MTGQYENPDPLTSLREEVGQLRRAVASHAVIDQAIGVVITVGSLHPEHGWVALRHISQHTNIKLREVAHRLVQWPATGRLPERIREALPAAVDHARGAATTAPADRDGHLGQDGHAGQDGHVSHGRAGQGGHGDPEGPVGGGNAAAGCGRSG
ncbi:ANTAR domain-containing protein [Streptomyces collinus]|uniref:ANTAR domain-containing protein n=1 Tax=Streptomyces collinus TaxID=42684 RepID=UPI0033ACED20